jgi:thymidylate synthase (FAD)
MSQKASPTASAPVKLVAITQGAGELINKNAQDVVAYITRVSNPSNQMNFETSHKLLAYCIRNAHWSPFEHAYMTVEIETTRGIAAQILRHRSFCLSGETRLTFELPNGAARGRRAAYKRTLKTLHDQFNEGAKPIPGKGLAWKMRDVQPDSIYSPRELAGIIGIAPENVRTFCREGRLVHQKTDGRIQIRGRDVIDSFAANRSTELRAPMADRIRRMRLRSFNEKTQEFETTRIKSIWSTGVRPVFKITTANGYSVKCTDDHPLLTIDGTYQTLSQALDVSITPNGLATFARERGMTLATNGIPVFRSKDWLAAQRAAGRDLAQIADAAACSPHTIRKWLKAHRLSFTRKEVAALHPAWNQGRTGYRIQPRTPEQRAHMRSITPRGREHHAYRGGGSAERRSIANWFNPLRGEIYSKFGHACQMCHQPFGNRRIELHHILEVSTHPELARDVSNVIPVHRDCHMKHHGRTFDYATLRKTHRGNALTVEWSKVVSVEYLGEETVYDLEVESPFHNFVADGIVVHNCFQEFSQRYAKAAEYEEAQARRQDLKNRQNSTDDLSADDKSWFTDAQRKIWEMSYGFYNQALEKGIAKESARFLLPLNTKTRIYMTGNARSWVHYIELRSAHGTQKEHMDIAEGCRKIFCEQFPDVARAKEWKTDADSGAV